MGNDIMDTAKKADLSGFFERFALCRLRCVLCPIHRKLGPDCQFSLLDSVYPKLILYIKQGYVISHWHPLLICRNPDHINRTGQV